MHTFTLTSADGETVNYQTAPHNPIEGQEIMFLLIGLGLEPIATALSNLLKREALLAVFDGLGMLDDTGGGAPDLTVEALLDRPLPDLIEAIGAVAEPVKLGEVASSIRGSLARVNAGDLIRDILRFTVREGKQLSDDAAFGRAYSRNYAEMLGAAWEVVRYNRFLPLPDTMLDASVKTTATRAIPSG